MGLFRRKKKEIYVIDFIFEYNPEQVITEIVYGVDVADAWKRLKQTYHAHTTSLVNIHPFNAYNELN